MPKDFDPQTLSPHNLGNMVDAGLRSWRPSRRRLIGTAAGTALALALTAACRNEKPDPEIVRRNEEFIREFVKPDLLLKYKLNIGNPHKDSDNYGSRDYTAMGRLRSDGKSVSVNMNQIYFPRENRQRANYSEIMFTAGKHPLEEFAPLKDLGSDPKASLIGVANRAFNLPTNVNWDDVQTSGKDGKPSIVSIFRLPDGRIAKVTTGLKLQVAILKVSHAA